MTYNIELGPLHQSEVKLLCSDWYEDLENLETQTYLNSITYFSNVSLKYVGSKEEKEEHAGPNYHHP